MRLTKRARREAIEAYVYLIPWILGMVFLTAGPLIAGLALGFTEWRAAVDQPPVFVGLKNFAYMFSEDPVFFQSLKVTFIFGAAAVLLINVAALAVAMLMNQDLPGMAFFRTAYYAPAVVSAVAVAITWSFVANRDFGVINWLLSLVGITGPNWLGSTAWALPSLVLMALLGTGSTMVIYLAGLQGIPRELHEAAMVDGAGWISRFRHVSLPMLSPTIFFCLVTGIIWALQVFAQVYVLTKGGPDYATYVFAYHIYATAFEQGRFGYASALGTVMFAIILALTSITFRTSGRWVYYSGGTEAK